MKSLNIVLVLIFVLTISSQCKESDDCHKTMRFVNNTANTLYVTTSFAYPDTLIKDPNPKLDPYFTKVQPNEVNTTVLSTYGRNCIETGFTYYGDTLMVFIFDAQVIDNTPWETVKSNYLILKRYDLSFQDIQNSDYTLTYP